MYLLIHSLVLVLVAVMKPKVLKTKISHADPPTLSLLSACERARMRGVDTRGKCGARALSASAFSVHRSLSAFVTSDLLCRGPVGSSSVSCKALADRV